MSPSYILILPPILLHQFQQLSKHLHPLRLHLPCIQQFPIMLQPSIIFTPLLRNILRRISFIRFNKRHHLIISCHPVLILCHCLSTPSVRYYPFCHFVFEQLFDASCAKIRKLREVCLSYLKLLRFFNKKRALTIRSQPFSICHHGQRCVCFHTPPSSEHG